MQITADVGKISKTVPRDLMFIYDELSEFVVIFGSSITMRKRSTSIGAINGS